MMFLWLALILICPIAMMLMMASGMRHGAHSPQTHGSGHDPLEIARTRLARGEITGEQYEAIRRTLTGEL